MKPVVIESPYAGDVARNVAYAKLAVRDCLARGESPYASHLFFTQDGLLDDTDPSQRQLGMKAGFAWGAKAELCAVYADYGISKGMASGISRAKNLAIEVEYRYILRAAMAFEPVAGSGGDSVIGRAYHAAKSFVDKDTERLPRPVFA